MSDLSAFHGPNAGYVLDLYDRYLHDPTSVDPDTRATFERVDPAEVEALAAARPRSGCPPGRDLGANGTDLRCLRRGRRGRAGAGDPRLRSSRCSARSPRHAAARRPGASSDVLRSDGRSAHRITSRIGALAGRTPMPAMPGRRSTICGAFTVAVSATTSIRSRSPKSAPGCVRRPRAVITSPTSRPRRRKSCCSA